MRRNVMRAILDETTKPGSKLRFFDCPISEFTADHVRLLRNRKKDTPAAANKRVAELRKMFEWGVEECSTWVKRNVVRDVASLKYEKEGFRAWTHADVAEFEKRWPVGTMPRLALAIMLFTGVRRSDAVRLGPPMVEDGSDHVHAAEDPEAEEGADPADPGGAAGRDRQDADRHEDLAGHQLRQAVHGERLRQLVPGTLRRGGPAKDARRTASARSRPRRRPRTGRPRSR